MSVPPVNPVALSPPNPVGFPNNPVTLAQQQANVIKGANSSLEIIQQATTEKLRVLQEAQRKALEDQSNLKQQIRARLADPDLSAEDQALVLKHGRQAVQDISTTAIQNVVAYNAAVQDIVTTDRNGKVEVMSTTIDLIEKAHSADLRTRKAEHGFVTEQKTAELNLKKIEDDQGLEQQERKNKEKEREARAKEDLRHLVATNTHEENHKKEIDQAEEKDKQLNNKSKEDDINYKRNMENIHVNKATPKKGMLNFM